MLHTDPGHAVSRTDGCLKTLMKDESVMVATSITQVTVVSAPPPLLSAIVTITI